MKEDVRAEIIKSLIKDNWSSVKAFAESIEMPYTTLRSMLERGIGNASIDNVIKVCRGLGITTDELEKMANRDSDIETIAAHHDGEDWTEEELEEIKKFKEFVRNKRNL